MYISDVYTTYYPYIPYGPNPGGAEMLTSDQLKEKAVTPSYVSVDYYYY